jgi:hypothetical protein
LRCIMSRWPISGRVHWCQCWKVLRCVGVSVWCLCWLWRVVFFISV